MSLKRALTTRPSFRTPTIQPRLTITAGLRWDIFGGKTERHNRLEYFNPTATNTVDGVSYTGAEEYVGSGNRSPFATNLDNFGPRLGFAWQPVKQAGAARRRRFLFWSERGDGGQRQPGQRRILPRKRSGMQRAYNADNNTVSNGSSGCGGQVGPGDAEVFTGPYSLTNPFPQGVVPLISSPSGLGNNLGNTLSTMLHSQRTQETYNFNFGVEYQLPHEFVFSAGYVGSRGLFLPLGVLDLNQLPLGVIAANGASLCEITSDPNCVMVPNTWAGHPAWRQMRTTAQRRFRCG